MNKNEIIQIFKEKFETDILYNGMIPVNSSLIDFVNDADIFEELVNEGIIQRRDCKGAAYELTPQQQSKYKKPICVN